MAGIGDLSSKSEMSSLGDLLPGSSGTGPLTTGNSNFLGFTRMESNGLTKNGALGYAVDYVRPDDNTLKSLLKTKTNDYNNGLANLSLLQDQAFNRPGAQPESFVPSEQINALGRVSLLNRLEETFGPNYEQDPRALAILRQFYQAMSDKERVAGIQKTLDASTNVLQYIRENPSDLITSLLGRSKF